GLQLMRGRYVGGLQLQQQQLSDGYRADWKERAGPLLRGQPTRPLEDSAAESQGARRRCTTDIPVRPGAARVPKKSPSARHLGIVQITFLRERHITSACTRRSLGRPLS